ncbi:hypothetical protein ACO0LB_06545 [Undibacterium sp. SXout7W]
MKIRYVDVQAAIDKLIAEDKPINVESVSPLIGKWIRKATIEIFIRRWRAEHLKDLIKGEYKKNIPIDLISTSSNDTGDVLFQGESIAKYQEKIESQELMILELKSQLKILKSACSSDIDPKGLT